MANAVRYIDVQRPCQRGGRAGRRPLSVDWRCKIVARCAEEGSAESGGSGGSAVSLHVNAFWVRVGVVRFGDGGCG